MLHVQVRRADKQTTTEPTVHTGVDPPIQPQHTRRMRKSNRAKVATKLDSDIPPTRLVIQGEASKADITGNANETITFDVAPKKKKLRGRPAGSKNKKLPAGANAWLALC